MDRAADAGSRVRGQGLGQKIVEGFVEHAAKEGAQSIMLGVVEENLAAYRFWQKVGFELVRTTEPRPFGKKYPKGIRDGQGFTTRASA